MGHARACFALGFLLAACGGESEENAIPGPVLRTDPEGAAADWFDQRRVTSQELLLSALEDARERLDALYETVTSRAEAEQETLESELDGLREKMTELEERARALADLQQMEWERAHDALKVDLRALHSLLRSLEARLR